ncbi:MAG: MBL fold metallo-hydrolase, partial [Eubacteriales bacterium]|nr:MBL fold metallo-hydrolase [Eubacteriales bacterium]
NAIFVQSGRMRILIDAGLSGKRLAEALSSIGEDPSRINALLITHEHIDHIAGAGVMSRRYDIPIYANERTWASMEYGLGKIAPKNKKLFCTNEEFCLEEFLVSAFAIPHDAAEPVGFNLFAADRKITVATDIGHMTRELLCRMLKSDILLIESNHDLEMLKWGSYPWSLKQRIMGKSGHLSNDVSGKVIAYLAETGMNKFLLGHLSAENNYPELAYKTACDSLEKKNVKPSADVFLDIAPRNGASKVLVV